MATPLWKKLGYKAGFQVKVINHPDGYFNWISGHPEPVDFEAESDLDLVHLFTNATAEMEQGLLTYQRIIKQNGMIWVSWYKRASKLPSELNEDIIRDTALALNLVDIKVCSVNEQWSGLKMVIPVKLRTK